MDNTYITSDLMENSNFDSASCSSMLHEVNSMELLDELNNEEDCKNENGPFVEN